jgi:hypothetical protein
MYKARTLLGVTLSVVCLGRLTAEELMAYYFRAATPAGDVSSPPGFALRCSVCAGFQRDVNCRGKPYLVAGATLSLSLSP